MQDAGLGNPSLQEWVKSLPPHLCFLHGGKDEAISGGRNDILDSHVLHTLAETRPSDRESQ